jgi:hypothetical protein
MLMAYAPHLIHLTIQICLVIFLAYNLHLTAMFMSGQSPNSKSLLAYVFQVSSSISYLTHPILFALMLQYQG